MCDYETQHDICVRNYSGITVFPDHVEVATEVLIDEYGRGRRVLRGVEVEFVSTPMWRVKDDSWCALSGQYDSGAGVARVVANTCLGQSSYQHEMMHRILIELDNNPDPGHRDRRSWSAVSRAKLKTFEMLCE